jgi:hypothetical protein
MRWQKLVLVSVMSAILTALHSQDGAIGATSVVVCPLEISGVEALQQALYRPLEFYQTYQHHWLQQPIGAAITLPPACTPEDNSRGPACEGCKDVSITYYECFHLRTPVERAEDCADNWCIIVDLKLKTCYARPAGTEPDRCRVLRRRTSEGAPPEVTHTVKYWRRHGESWCRLTSNLRGPTAIVHYGCPICDEEVMRQRIWCPADKQSIEKCKQGQLVPKDLLGQENPIRSEYGFVCANDDCTPRREPDQPREQ